MGKKAGKKLREKCLKKTKPRYLGRTRQGGRNKKERCGSLNPEELDQKTYSCLLTLGKRA